MIIYDKFWETLKEKGISQYKLINEFHVSAGQLSRMRANQNINTHTVDMLCNIIGCNVEDIMTHIPD